MSTPRNRASSNNSDGLDGLEGQEAMDAIFENDNFGSSTTTTTGPSQKNLDDALLRRVMAESLDSRFAVRPPSSSAVVNRGRVLQAVSTGSRGGRNESSMGPGTPVPVPGPRPNYMKRMRNYVETRRPMRGVYSPEDQQAVEKEFRELERQQDHELLRKFYEKGLIPGSIEYNPAAVATNEERAELSRLGYGAEAAGGRGAAAAGGRGASAAGGFGGGSSSATEQTSGGESKFLSYATKLGINPNRLIERLERLNMTFEGLLDITKGNMVTAKTILGLKQRRNTRRRRTTSRKSKRRTHS